MKIKEEVIKLKSWLLIITYAFLLAFVLFNYQALFAFAYRVIRILDPLFYGLIFAFVLNIPMVKIENYIDKHRRDNYLIMRFKRVIAIGLSTLGLLIIALLFWALVVPEIFNSIQRLIMNFTSYFNELIANIDRFLAYFNFDISSLNNLTLEEIFLEFGIDYSALIRNLSNWILGTSFNTIEQFVNFSGLLFRVFMGMMICFYLLGSKEKFIINFKKVIYAFFNKNHAQKMMKMLETSNLIFKDFVGGRLVEVFVVGILVYIPMLIFKIEFAPLVASMCAIATIVPVFGSLIVNIIVVIILLSINPFDALLFVIIYQVVMNLDGNFIYPKFIGSSLGLPAVWILVSVILFGGLFGAFGMLIAVPLTACIYTFMADLINTRLKDKAIEIQ